MTASPRALPPYYADPAPGSGSVPPRAVAPSSAPALSLDGDWRFRLLPTADAESGGEVSGESGGEADGDGSAGGGFAEVGFDDSGWGLLPVPGHWQLHGHGSPAYTNIRYPFPVDPPHVPDENPTGEYRHGFDLPQDWPGVGDGSDGGSDGGGGEGSGGTRTLLRFDGVDSCFRVWLNGTLLGHAMGSRLAHEFEVGRLLRPGRNTVAVRVHQWSTGSYLEDQDMWWLSGIFRSVTLLTRPEPALDDFFVHAGYDHTTGGGTLSVDTPSADASGPVLLSVPELGLHDVDAAGPHTLPAVEPWSAEQPRLYAATLRTAHETLTLRIGFRSIAIEDGVLRVNGRRILFRGVNRHEWHPEQGRALDRATMLADVLLMKRHGINAVRTSHYPPHADFLDLCDEYGLWVIDECDLETHGFEKVGWRRNPSDDPRWLDACLDRMRRTVERDKNHPSVLLWSLGNESGHGANLEAMSAWCHDRDPERPVHYEGDWDSPYVDVYSRMYPSHAEVEAIGRRAEKPASTPERDVHRRALPFLMCEYAHAMGNGPGGLSEYQQLFERYERLQGGFVWEWIDHGIPRRDADGNLTDYAYGGDFGEPLHDGNFIADGLLFPDRTPSPGLVEFAKVIEPVRITAAPGGGLLVANLYDVLPLDHVAFHWTLEQEGVPLAAGRLDVPPTGGENWLTVRAVLAAEQPWAPAGHELAWGQLPVPASVSATVPATARASVPAPGAGTDADAAEQLTARIRALFLDGPRLDVWRAPTDNDHGGGSRSLAAVWRALGLDRMRHRTVSRTVEDGGLLIRTRVAPAASDLGLLADYRWSDDAGRLRLDLRVEPEGDWDDVPLPRLGLRLALPSAIGRVDWFGLGPGESYRDSRAAARVGRFGSDLEALQTPCVMPQENGNRSGTRWAAFTDANGAGLRVDGPSGFDFTARRWTSEDLDAARHTGDLRPGDRVVLNLDHSHHGLGTASCGPGVLPQHRLTAAPAQLTLLFTGLTGATDPTDPGNPAGAAEQAVT